MALINILARLGIDSTSYQAGLKKAESTASAAGRVIRSHLAQAFTVAAVSKFTYDMVNLAGRIKDSAEQFNLTRKEAQELMRVAQDSGVSFEQLAQSVNKVNRQRGMAMGGNKDAKASFEALGISMSRVSDANVRSADIFYDLGRALKDASIEQQAAATKLLGDEAAKLFPAMKGIADMGPLVLLTDDQVEKIDRVGKLLSHAKDDLTKIAAGTMGETMDAYNKTVAQLGGGRVAQAVTAPAAAIAGALRFFTSGFRKDGNTDEGRLDLESALAARAAKIKGTKDDPVAAAVASTIGGGAGAGVGVSDPLAKIGGLFFGADAGMRAIPQRQLDELRRLNARVERIERAATSD